MTNLSGQSTVLVLTSKLKNIKNIENAKYTKHKKLTLTQTNCPS